ncbi:protein IQ-DOMAIN 14-like [Hibiscus syriacus]|uniref:protein IQ-DOMAIN 14-like n=1 Tax=Hibiscus syriacus TaxID=106335 RepID=UPI001922BAAA|nr:protein IQ-DOMAIN 14-like [Hibiscus syriacus]
MGKASKWFRSILGLKRRDPHKPSSKRRWSFVKSSRDKDSFADTNACGNSNAMTPSSQRGLRQHQQDLISVVDTNGGCDAVDHNMHAIAVAAATAAVSEAAVAAAQAAAAVVRLTSSSGRCARDHVSSSSSYGELEELTAVKIQSTFRGYLARRALRALKGLVRLQALVRGHIERKRIAEWLRNIQALLQEQARTCAGRAQISQSSRLSSKSSHFQHAGPLTFEHAVQLKSSKYEQSSMLKRNGSRLSGRNLDSYEQIDERIGPMDDEIDDGILEVDTGKPHFASKCRNLFHSTHLAFSSDLYGCSFTNSRDSHQMAPLNPFKYSREVEESPFCTADNSPNFCSASSRGGSSNRSPFTPAMSDGSRSNVSGYSDHPNYMAYTESSRAKVRSLSAPKLRPQHDRSSSTKRYSIQGIGELKSSTLKSVLYTNFASKGYPGSGRLDRLGMPVGY